MESTYIRSANASESRSVYWFWYVHLPLLATSIGSLWLVDRAARYRMLDETFQIAAFLSCFFVFTAATIAVLIDRRGDRNSRATAVLFYSLLLAPLVLMSILVANGGLDTSEARSYATTVAAKHSACGFPRPRCIYTVELASWRGRAGTESLHVNEQSFGKLKLGQPITVVARKGWLGLPWIQSVAFSAPDRGPTSESRPDKVGLVISRPPAVKPPRRDN